MHSLRGLAAHDLLVNPKMMRPHYSIQRAAVGLIAGMIRIQSRISRQEGSLFRNISPIGAHNSRAHPAANPTIANAKTAHRGTINGRFCFAHDAANITSGPERMTLVD